MLRSISPPSTLNLLEFLVPSLICRARAFSTAPSAKANAASRSKRPDVPVLHSKIRDQIMGQAHRRIIPDALKKKHNDSLSGIKKALEIRDLNAALEHWQSLQEQKEAKLDEELYRLPEQTERQMSSLFHSQFTKMQSTWSDDVRNVARNFALQAAATRDIIEALHTLLLDHLDRNEPQAVVDLFHTYQQTLEKVTAERTSSLGPDNQLSLVEVEDDDSHFHPGRAMLLLVAVAAHAVQDSFQAALNTYQLANIRPPVYRKQELLQAIQKNPDLSRKVQDYLHRLGVASIVSRPTSLSKHIMNISHPRSTRQLEQLYNDVLEGISGPEPYLAVDASGVSTTTPIAMTEVGWTAFQTGFIRCERTDMAAQMWEDLAKCGFTPGVTMWTALLDTYADLRDSTQAMTTWNSMLEHDIKPDTLSYRAIISALFVDNKPADALNRFREYHKTLKDKSDLALSVYNTVLQGLLRINRIADAKSLLTVMEKKGPKPDIVSFNTFLGYYGRQNDFKELSNVVAQMSAANIPGDVVTFSTILTALLNVGRKDATMTILNLMRKQGIKPNVATYSAIIDHQMREHKEGNLTAALSVLDKMEQDESTKPNEVTYTSILSGLYRNQSISRKRAEQVRKDIVARMRRANVSFRLPTYHILIRAAMDSSDPDGYLDALALIHEMEKQGIPMTNTAWYLIFAGLMHRGLWDVAKEMVEKLISSGQETTPRLEKLINDIQRH